MKEKKYTMGVLKEDFCNYCLIASSGFIILTKQMRLEDEIEFDIEVSNLSKYFNAEVIIEDFVNRREYPKKSDIYKNIDIDYPYYKGKISSADNEEAIKWWDLMRNK